MLPGCPLWGLGGGGNRFKVDYVRSLKSMDDKTRATPSWLTTLYYSALAIPLPDPIRLGPRLNALHLAPELGLLAALSMHYAASDRAYLVVCRAAALGA